MARKRKSEWRWFVHGDTGTNAVIASRFDADESAYTMLRCSDGERRDMWELDRPFLDRMLLDQRNLNLHFEVFVDDQGNGRPRRYAKVSFAPVQLKASA